MTTQQASNKPGFSLIELLVVISIMATLMAILLPNFMGARERAKDAQKKQDMEAIRTALRMYYNDNQSYPKDQAAMLTAVPSYSPGMSNIGYTYNSPAPNDSFSLTTGLEAPSLQDTDDSFLK
ncbi:MAG TPA: type II secretion system protein, partial [Patescibacteria group bacterium]